ncbi:phage tail tape measure protein [Abyssisolibacter fermentans]|uniref:phage tail tape measure protein n=1 Tax=Abyssisolibacter fermentans TaxID=1766203 RepID=UPI0008294F11|nr:phage tail tape measure protein [Abyssisolibacter fermentans]
MDLTTVNKDIKTMQSLINETESDIKKLGSTFSKSIKQIDDNFKSSSINKKAIQSVIDIYKAFEKEQTKLRRSLKATNEEMKKLTAMTIEVGKATGKSVQEIQAIENLWVNAGVKSLNVLKELVNITSIGLNTANFRDAGEAVTFLSDAVNKMAGGDFSKAGGIIDSWTNIAHNTQTSVRNLAEIISTAGRQAQKLGVDFHRLNAITTVLSENMSLSSHQIGASLKSMFDNIGALSGKLDKLSLEDYSISLNADSSFDDGFQSDITSSLIENWNEYGEIVEMSLNSSGCALEQNNLVMQDFNMQVEALKTAMTELAICIGEDGLNSILDLASGTDEAISSFDGLSPKMREAKGFTTELFTAFGRLNTTTSLLAKTGIIEWLNGIIQKNTGIKVLANAEQLLNQKVVAGTISATDRTNILKVLRGEEVASTLQGRARTAMLEAETTVTYGATAATTALTTAISAGLIVIPMIISAVSAWSSAQEELNKNALENINSQQEEIENIDNLISEYEALKQKSNSLGGQTALTANEKQRLLEIEEKFAEIYPSTVTGINAQNKAYSNQLDIIKQLTDKKKKELLDDTQNYVDANSSEYKEAQDKIKEAEEKKKNAANEVMKKKLLLGILSPINPLNSKPSKEEIAEYKIKQQAIIDENQIIVDTVDNKKKLINNLASALYGDTFKKVIDELPTIPGTKDLYKGLADKGIKYQRQESDKNVFNENSFNNKLDELRHKYRMDDLSKSEYSKELDKLLQDNKRSLEKKIIWQLEEQIKNLTDDTGENNHIEKPYQKQIKELKHRYKIKELNKEDYATELNRVLDTNKDLMKQDEIWRLEEQIYNLKNSKKGFSIDYNELKTSLNSLNQELKLLEKEEKMINLLGEDKSKLFPVFTKQMQNYKNTIDELNNLNKKYISSLEEVDDMISKLDPDSDDYDKTLNSLINNKRKLTQEIEKNTLSIQDNQYAIEKIKITMQGQIESLLKKSYSLKKEMAAQILNNNHKKDLEALKDEQEKYNERMKTSIANKQSELDMLDEQISKQEYLNEITNIKDEISKVKADTRFAYIDEASGREIYTYDRNRVAELEKQLEEREQQEENSIKRKLLEDELTKLQEAQTNKNENYDEEMRKKEEQQRIELENFNLYWNKKLSDESIKQQSLNLIQSEGYNNALTIAQIYYEDMNNEYEKNSLEAFTAGEDITNSLAGGLFANLNKVIDIYKEKLRELTNLKNKTSSKSAKRSYRELAGFEKMTPEDFKKYKQNKLFAETIAKFNRNWNHKDIEPYRKENEDLREHYGIGKDNDKYSYSDLKKYHTGGFIGGKPLNKRHEVVAKFLKGELVTSIPALDMLSIKLPQMTYNSISTTNTTTQPNASSRPIMIQIDKLTPSDFNDFMRSIDPYIISHK